MKGTETLGKTCAIVVTYNTGEKYAANFLSYCEQVDNIIIVDNSTDEVTINMLKGLEEQHGEKLKIIFNQENLGLARAQNIGIREALADGAEWVLLLDDDSIAARGMVEKMEDTYEIYPKKELLAIIAPQLQDPNTNLYQPFMVRFLGVFFRRARPEELYLDNVLSVIAAGSLIKAKALAELGDMREDFFIDYVDTEFCLRAVKSGWKIIAAREAELLHSIGSKSLHKFSGIRMVASNHTAMRRFTIYRNRVRLWKAYIFSVPGYIIYDMLAAVWDIFRIIMLESEKGAKLCAVLKGIRCC